MAENEDLPPEIRDDIWDMLTNVSKTVQEEKARQVADSLTEYSSDKNDEFVSGSERRADSDLMLDVRQTPVYGDSERPVDKYLVQKVARKTSDNREFQTSADADLALLARKEMPRNIEYENSVEEVLMQQANTSGTCSRENVNPTDTDLLMVAARGIPPKIESNSSSDTDVVVIKGKKVSDQIESTAFGITETKPKFGSIMDVSVEMDNTGETIYSEIAAFFGCKYFSFLF